MSKQIRESCSLNPTPQRPDFFFEPANLSNKGVELFAKYPSLIHGTLGNPLCTLGCAKVHHVSLMLAYERFLQTVHAGHERATCAAQFLDEVSTKAA